MSRRISSESHSSSSNNRANFSTYDVNESLQHLTVLLETLSEKVIENENVKEETLKELKDKILDISKETAVLAYDNTNITTIISEITNRQINNLTSNTISDRIAEVKEIAKKRFPNNFDGANSDSYKKLKMSFDRKLNASNDDEDLYMADKLTEADFKCPFSAMPFVEPMKK